MFDNFEAYFAENINSVYYEYLKKRRSLKAGRSKLLKLAISLSNNLYHLREHIPEGRKISFNELVDLCPDYLILRDVSNYSKHKEIKNYIPLISSAEDIFEISSITIYKDEQGDFNHIQDKVYVKLNNGTERDLHTVIINVLNTWIKVLQDRSLISRKYNIKRITKRIPKRTKYSGRQDIEVLKDIRFKHHIKLSRYNYEKGIAEPVDLTGKNIRMNIYENLYTVSLTIKSESGNEEIIEISVDEKMKRRFEKGDLDDKKVEEFMKIAKEQGKIKNYNIKE